MQQPIDTAALNANQFTWTGKTGVAEASDLQAPTLTALFPSAIHLSGNRERKTFKFVGPFYNDEDELVAWVYQTEDKCFDIHILND
jgi:hypothetical protein